MFSHPDSFWQNLRQGINYIYYHVHIPTGPHGVKEEDIIAIIEGPSHHEGIYPLGVCNMQTYGTV